MNSNQPTILVKKADGTSVRMTLDEVKKMKAGQNPVPVPMQTPSDKKTEVQEIKPSEMPTEKKEKLSAEDLEKQMREFDKIQAKKDIPDMDIHKSPIEALEDLKKPEILPVTEVPLMDEEEIAKWSKDDNKSLLDDEFHKEDLPAPINNEKMVLSTTAPVKNIFTDQAKANLKDNKISAPVAQAKKHVIDIPKAEPVWTPKPKNPAPITALGSKPVVQDIQVQKPKKQSIGPIDELEHFNLVEFRRLNSNPAIAGEKLFDKFKNLESDSYTLFLEGVEAWYNSPLYKEYQEIISRSLLQNRSVMDIIAETNPAQNIKMEEFKAILKLSDQIR